MSFIQLILCFLDFSIPEPPTGAPGLVPGGQTHLVNHSPDIRRPWSPSPESHQDLQEVPGSLKSHVPALVPVKIWIHCFLVAPVLGNQAFPPTFGNSLEMCKQGTSESGSSGVQGNPKIASWVHMGEGSDVFWIGACHKWQCVSLSSCQEEPSGRKRKPINIFPVQNGFFFFFFYFLLQYLEFYVPYDLDFHTEESSRVLG